MLAAYVVMRPIDTAHEPPRPHGRGLAAWVGSVESEPYCLLFGPTKRVPNLCHGNDVGTFLSAGSKPLLTAIVGLT